jgi:hypothetical protein
LHAAWVLPVPAATNPQPISSRPAVVAIPFQNDMLASNALNLNDNEVLNAARQLRARVLQCDDA